MWMKCITVHMLAFGSLTMSIGDLITCKHVCGHVTKTTKNVNLHCTMAIIITIQCIISLIITVLCVMAFAITVQSVITLIITVLWVITLVITVRYVITLIITDWYVLQLNNTVKFVMTLIITDWFVIRLYITVQCVIELIVSLYNFTSMCLDTEVHFFSWSCIWYGRYVGGFENLINKAWISRQCQMIALVNGWIIIVVVFKLFFFW